MPPKKTPVELFEIASAGGKAQTVSQVMGDVLQKEMDVLLSHFGNPKKTPEEWAYLAGQVNEVNKILSRIRYEKHEGEEAVEKLRR